VVVVRVWNSEETHERVFAQRADHMAQSQPQTNQPQTRRDLQHRAPHSLPVKGARLDFFCSEKLSIACGP
jgi:hypothetical protein